MADLTWARPDVLRKAVNTVLEGEFPNTFGLLVVPRHRTPVAELPDYPVVVSQAPIQQDRVTDVYLWLSRDLWTMVTP